MNTGHDMPPEQHTESGRPERAAILAAARIVASRDGVHALTLRSVASQAGISRQDLTAHFANKADLLLAAAADDLTAISGALRGASPLERPPPIPAAELTELFSGMADAGETDMPAAAKKRREAEELDALVARLVPSGKYEGTAEGIARVERRMSVFERALADMDARCTEIARNGREIFKTSEQSVLNVTQRLELLDKRLVETAAEIHAQIRDLTERVDQQRTINGPDLSGEFPPPPPIIPMAQSGGVSVQNGLRVNPPPHLTSSQTHAFKRHKRKTYPIPQRHLLIVGAVAIFVILITLGIAFRRHLFDGGTAVIASAGASPLITPASVATGRQDRLLALAESGNPKAELIAGLRYLDGKGYAKDGSNAVHWLERAADDGEAIAQYRLGVLYLHGAGVTQDVARALSWYKAAAEQGNRKAMHNLGVAYAQPAAGVRQNFAAAAQWFKKAAHLGYVDSQFNLAVLYERGEGVPQNLTEAYKWYAVAAAHGDLGSKARIAILTTQMTARQLAQARHAAHIFRAAPLDTVANVAPVLNVPSR